MFAVFSLICACGQGATRNALVAALEQRVHACFAAAQHNATLTAYCDPAALQRALLALATPTPLPTTSAPPAPGHDALEKEWDNTVREAARSTGGRRRQRGARLPVSLSTVKDASIVDCLLRFGSYKCDPNDDRHGDSAAVLRQRSIATPAPTPRPIAAAKAHRRRKRCVHAFSALLGAPVLISASKGDTTDSTRAPVPAACLAPMRADFAPGSCIHRSSNGNSSSSSSSSSNSSSSSSAAMAAQCRVQLRAFFSACSGAVLPRLRGEVAVAALLAERSLGMRAGRVVGEAAQERVRERMRAAGCGELTGVGESLWVIGGDTPAVPHSPQQCMSGRYHRDRFATTAGDACVACPAGKYQPHSGRFGCFVCIGAQLPALANCPPPPVLLPPPAPMLPRTVMPTPQSARVVLRCAPGQGPARPAFSSVWSCAPCPAGRWGAGEAHSCVLCERGRWGAGGSRSALCSGACRAGRWGGLGEGHADTVISLCNLGTLRKCAGRFHLGAGPY